MAGGFLLLLERSYSPREIKKKCHDGEFLHCTYEREDDERFNCALINSFSDR